MLTVLSCIFIVVKQIFANSKENVGKFKNYKSPLHLLLSSTVSERFFFLISTELFKVEVLDLHFYHFKLFPF